jgi:hypothetical protein
MPIKSDPTRAALADAIKERDRLGTVLFRAQQVEERGQQLLTEAESRLVAFSGVDDAINEFRASKFQKAAEAAEDAPKTITLPPSLVARERARDEAKATVAAAKSAHRSLAAEREQAERAVRKAEQKVTTLAIEIVTAEGNLQGERLRQAWRDMWAQTDLVAALIGMWLPYPGEGLKPARLSLPTTTMLTHISGYDHRQFAGGHNPTLAKATAKWKAFLSALSVDADAQFDEEKTEATAKERAA